jgi:benzoyl-CoA-dihydrodiol lyase
MRRVLKRFDVTSKSIVALVEANSCFAGSLCEFLHCADQSFLALGTTDESEPQIFLNGLSLGLLPKGNSLSRLEQRFWGDEKALEKVNAALMKPLGASDCEELGLVTHVLDEIDYDEEVRIFCEERASLSPDALTGMEASLRFAGPETMESKIFARLSAWQNWIFIRDNATGERGALTNYGKPTRPQFDYERC